MTTESLAERGLVVDKQGNLVAFDDWDEAVAETLATREGLVLSEAHWVVINFLRDYYQFNEIPPSPRLVIQSVGDSLSPHVPCTRKHLARLFPDGGCKQACRIAGLPRHYCGSC